MPEYVDERADDSAGRANHAVARPGPAAAAHRWLGGFLTTFFTLALITDFAYMETALLQWQYFSIWLITAALIMGAFAVVAGIIDWATGGAHGRRGFGWHFGLTILALIVGLVNAFIHSRDGWVAVVPQGILLSLLTVILLYAGGIIAALFDRPRTRVVEEAS